MDPLPITRLLRIGLRQFAAGMLSVLTLGILNRVMKVEMGLELSLVSVIIAVHYFSAPLAIPLGHRSDTRPLFGLYRTPYILGGAALTIAATVAAPLSALLLETHGGALPYAALAALVFLLLGAGNYTAGTAYISLIADLTTQEERGRAIAVVWSMMMVGILAGVGLGVGVLNHYTATNLIALFSVMAALVGGLTVASIWRVERRCGPQPSSEKITNREAWQAMASSRQTRLFFFFLFSGILFLFIQNTVLEPFGGDVFGMGVGETTRFNAFQMVGVLGAMAIAGRWLSPRLGNKLTASLGLILASASFLALGFSSLTRLAILVPPSILIMGAGMGLFNVGGLALMMGMSVEGRTGMYMGAWTLSQAIANGVASISGGAIHDLTLSLSGTEATAYAAVFLTEALGVLITLIILGQLSLERFRQETSPAATMWAEVG
jgi:BCD family chlorophyll transporter-like MFS transporter